MKLPRQLSPQAKKAVLQSTGERRRCLLTVSPHAERERLRAALEKLGAEVESWLDDQRLTVVIEDRRLAELAELRDVVLVELPARYSPAGNVGDVDLGEAG